MRPPVTIVDENNNVFYNTMKLKCTSTSLESILALLHFQILLSNYFENYRAGGRITRNQWRVALSSSFVPILLRNAKTVLGIRQKSSEIHTHARTHTHAHSNKIISALPFSDSIHVHLKIRKVWKFSSEDTLKTTSGSTTFLRNSANRTYLVNYVPWADRKDRNLGKSWSQYLEGRDFVSQHNRFPSHLHFG